jgi:type IV pilus assembly protein PilB
MSTTQQVVGNLSDKNVLELLMEWHRERRSGSIQAARKGIQKRIYFKQGSILRAESNQDKDRLGQALVRRNLISPWDLEVALSQLKDNSKRLGEVLLGMAALKEPVLNNTLVSQTRDIIFSMVDWEEGEYVAEQYEIPDEVPFDQLFTPEIILQGVRRISNIVVLLRPLGELRSNLRLAPDYLERIRKIMLLTEEKSVLALLHRPSTLKDLLKTSGMEKTTVYRAVAALLSVGVLSQESQVQPKVADTSGAIKIGGAAQVSDSSPALSMRSKGRKQLGEMLVGQKVISEEQLKEALKAQSASKSKKQFLGNLLVQLGYATEDAIIDCLSGQLDIKKIESIEISEDAPKLIPAHLARKYYVCPISKSGSVLEVAMLDPTNMAALDDLSFVTGYRIRPMITTNKALQEAWEKIYGIKEEKGVEKADNREETTKRNLSFQDFTKDEEALAEAAMQSDEEVSAERAFHFDVNELESLVSGVVGDLQVVSDDALPTREQLSVSDAPIVKLVDTILRQAITTGASDIHIEPWENKLQIRFRLDGTMHKVMSFPHSITSALTSRIKILSKMDIAERRRPQDGRVKMRMGKKRTVDYRVSCVPTVYGERVVMRVLDRSSLQIDMTKLGFDAAQLELFKKAIDAPHGMMLCTGPTGSGKTTTLYSALGTLDHGSMNILTVEDPVEYNFPGISQVQVNDQINVTFANCLRSFLRQDPDVIMVGEIRDSETAEISAKAALTGHLVLSTVHTNDAPSAIGRLIDLGLKPYMVSACLNMVIAQRLLRKICQRCKTEVQVDKKVLVDAGMTEEEADNLTLFLGKGCDICNNSGYYGRCGIYEIMPVTRRIKSAVAADLPSDQIKDIAISEGMKDLRRAALEKVILGITSLQEAIQNTISE